MNKTPVEIKKGIQDFDYKTIHEWDSMQQIETGFLLIRDEKIITFQENQYAIPWKYEDNGCFLRASMARRILKAKGYPSINKIFVFGNFKFKSQFDEKRIITFKDHTAIIVRFEDQVYVLDPTVNYESYQTLKSWLSKLNELSDNQQVEYSICNELTVGKNSNCFEYDPKNEFAIRSNRNYTLEELAIEYIKKQYPI